MIKDDGSEYQGDFRFDTIHGAGRWRSREGDVYEGKFAEVHTRGRTHSNKATHARKRTHSRMGVMCMRASLPR